MFFDWIMGVALWPGKTFERSREQLRFGYWWIVLAVITLETVVGIYRPKYGYGTEDWADAAFFVLMFDLVLFDVQALLLMGAGRLVQWKATWPEVTKLTGLLWSIIFVEDLATFYPAMKGLDQVELWTSAAFGVWYLITMAVGLRKTAKLDTTKALLVTLGAGLLWRGGVFWLAFSTFTGQP